MKLKDWFDKEVVDIDTTTKVNYLTYIRQIPYQTPEELMSDSDENIIHTLINVWSTVGERQKTMCRAAFIKLLVLINRESLRIKLPKEKTPERKIKQKWIDFATLKQLINKIDNDEVRLVTMLEYETCSRVSAILALERDNIDFIHNKITITEPKVKESKVFTLHDSTLNFLKSFAITKTGKVFSVSYWTVYTTQKKVFKDNEHPKMSTHWMRSCRAVHWIQQGYDIETVKRLGGWKTADSVLKYIKESGVEIEKVVKNEGEIWR